MSFKKARSLHLVLAQAEAERRAKVVQRFWAKVSRGGDNECWEWTAYRTESGYGSLTIERLPFKAHRVAYELTIGPIPRDLVLDHLCRNRACVNPAHLEPVTQSENVLRGDLESTMKAVYRRHRERTHCKWGHEYSDTNTYTPPGTNVRVCRTCIRNRAREYQARKRQANASLV